MTWTWWMTLLTIFAALVLIGCIPVGVDARYNAEGVFLAAKLGPIRLQLLPHMFACADHAAHSEKGNILFLVKYFTHTV